MIKLSDEAINEAFDGDFGEVPFDHYPKPEELMLIKLRLVARKAEQEILRQVVEALNEEWLEVNLAHKLEEVVNRANSKSFYLYYQRCSKEIMEMVKQELRKQALRKEGEGLDV